MGKELPAMNNYTWHILFRVLTTTAQPGQDTVFKYSRWKGAEKTFKGEQKIAAASVLLKQ